MSYEMTCVRAGAETARPTRPEQWGRAPPARAMPHTAAMQEAEVRAAVTRRVEFEHRTAPDTLVVHELGLARAGARIDIAVVNGRLTGWEIKTAADSLVRLPHQQRAYSQVFDRVWLAADRRHIQPALEMVPWWWGIVRADQTDAACVLRVVRPSRLNRDVDLLALVRLLWRDEVAEELSGLGAARTLLRAPREVLWNALAAAVPGRLSRSALQARVRLRLRSRAGWRADSPRR